MKKISVLTLLFLFLFGCRSEERPKDLPRLYPCSIRVVQDRSPVDEVRVSLYDETTSRRWAIGGMTDKSGIATIRTHGFPGVPAGRFRVVLDKTESEGIGWTGNEQNSQQEWEDIKVYSMIDSKYREVETTILEIIIENKKTDQTFDVGQPVRQLIQTIGRNDS